MSSYCLDDHQKNVVGLNKGRHWTSRSESVSCLDAHFSEGVENRLAKANHEQEVDRRVLLPVPHSGNYDEDCSPHCARGYAHGLGVESDLGAGGVLGNKALSNKKTRSNCRKDNWNPLWYVFFL